MHTPGTYLTSSSVLGPDGEPWQKSHGYAEGLNLPHVLTFSSLIGSAWRTYYHGQQDDATRNDPQFAEAMRRDPQLMALMQERIMATVSLKWHIEAEDDRDPQMKAMADAMTAIINQTPRLSPMLEYLLEAVWYGKYGAQFDYEWRTIRMPDPRNPGQKGNIRVPVVAKHVPLEGDKLGYKHDGTPYILVHGTASGMIPQAEMILTSAARAIDLVGTWRDKFVIHQHQMRDAPFTAGERGSAIYGIGVRHTLFWLAWLKKELLANILDYCERTGLGLRVWYYQGGNPTSKAEVERAASLQTNRTNVIVPRFPNQVGKSSEAVEFVDTGSQGANILGAMIDRFDEDAQRLIIGQTLSASTEGSGLGGTGVATMHAETKHRLVAFDAGNLAETLTQDWILKVQRWAFPDLAEAIPVKFVFETNTPDPAGKLDAVQKAWSMGVTFPEDRIRELTGIPAPQEGDTPISQVSLQQQLGQLAQQQQIPGDGDGDGIPNEDGEPTEDDYQQLLAEMGAA